MRAKTFKQRFEAKFRVTPGCWIWTAATRNGYGAIKYAGKMLRAHRSAYELYSGTIPDGLLVRHECDNRLCVNPDHLLLGSHANNMQDMVDRGRTPNRKGANNGQSKLTNEQVLAIRSDARSQRKIAMDYGIDHTTVCDIKREKSWQHILEKTI